jgi:pyruvate-ferredoxin/flavodoxin oxidoreductase
VRSSAERRSFWRQLRALAGEYQKVDLDAVIARTKAEMAQKLSASLLAMAAGGGGALIDMAPAKHGGNGGSPALAGGAAQDWEPVWVETPQCTACDECININPKLFAYNDQKQVIVVDPKGGPFKDVVKAAEKCTAGCIHPGTPWNSGEKDLDKLVKRAEKYQ